MKFSEYFYYDRSADKAEKVNVKGKVLKSLYKNVRIPWLLIMVGAILAVFNSIVILTQYENYLAIFTGALTDLSPLFQYLAASFVQYLLIFASILSDIAFVTIVTGVRKKMWKIAATVGGSKKLVSVFAMEEENTETGAAFTPAAADITLKDITFGYQEATVIDHVSAVIPKGKVTAIIGPNGSGKSTLIKLIDRLYPTESGDLRIGEADAFDVSLKSWRSQFAVVSQNTAAFAGTIRSNICYGALEPVSEESLHKAVHLANLEEVIASHQGGLDYEIGVKGVGLSGGEQQRLAIARALIKDPQVLILDEATANLDAKTEAAVKKGLNELMKGRTVIEIAHSYAAIQDADYVIVLDQGKLVDSGSPRF